MDQTLRPVDALPEEIRVLDHGFVRYVDSMGSDRRIVECARQSYGDATRSFRSDRALIRYLMRCGHSSPFESVVISFHLKFPIFVERHVTRHRTASINSLSGRYSEYPDEFYLPPVERIRPQSSTNRQGSAPEPMPADEASAYLDEWRASQAEAYRLYRKHLDSGMARELARINLPQSLYTTCQWTMNLNNLFRFLRLRLDAHAQDETRAVAEAIATYTRRLVPVAYEAFCDYVLGAVTFSALELRALAHYRAGDENGHFGMSAGEWREFEEKIRKISALYDGRALDRDGSAADAS